MTVYYRGITLPPPFENASSYKRVKGSRRRLYPLGSRPFPYILSSIPDFEEGLVPLGSLYRSPVVRKVRF